MTAFYIPTGHYVVVLKKWSLSAECVVQHDSLDITNIPQPASERDANEQKHGCHDNTQSYSTVCIMRSHEICSLHCASKKKAYKRGYVYWYKHMIAPPSEDNMGHFFKLYNATTCIFHVHTVCSCECMYCTCMCVHSVCMCKCLCASECTNVLSLLMQTIHACGVI